MQNNLKISSIKVHQKFSKKFFIPSHGLRKSLVFLPWRATGSQGEGPVLVGKNVLLSRWHFPVMKTLPIARSRQAPGWDALSEEQRVLRGWRLECSGMWCLSQWLVPVMKRGCFPSSWLCLIERKALPCEIVLEFLKMSCLFVEMQCFSNTVFAPTERSSLWQIFPVDALPFLLQWQCSFCGKLVLALIGQVTRRVQSFPWRR